MRFKIAKHGIRPIDIVEVYDERGRFIATITPGDSDGHIRVISKYLVDSALDLGPARPEVIAGLRQMGKPLSDYPKSVEVQLDLNR